MPESVDLTRKVPVYFVGTVLMEAMKTLTHAPVYMVKDRVYLVPALKGVPQIGAALMVFERDVDDLLFKSRMNTPSGPVLMFTLDANIAAGVKEAWERGESKLVPVEMSVEAASRLLTPELLKQRAGETLSEDDLEDLLAQRRAETSANSNAPKKKATPPPVIARL